MNKEFLQYKSLLDDQLNNLMKQSLPAENPLREGMEYSISAAGKRIRGVLTMVFCKRLGVSEEQALPFAVALELIHAYSLVHDDMPEMDNDDFRRGLPTCHKKFGVSTALLVGDGILNFSMEYLLNHRKNYDAERFLDAMNVLYNAAGVQGMLLGQMLDKEGEQRLLTEAELLELHRRKTGALLSAPVFIAQALAGATNESYVNYCKSIGLAFQIKDDLLDLEGSAEILGKETGKDLEEHKSTFITILGVDQTKKALKKEIDAATACAGSDEFLLWLAQYIANRQK